MAKKAKTKEKKYKKANIPKAIREQCWLSTMGKNMKINVMFHGVQT